MAGATRKLPLCLLLTCAIVSTGLVKSNDFNFVCPQGWHLYEGDCYQIVVTPLTWRDARDSCRSYGAELVTVKDSVKNSKVGEFFKAASNETLFWIGLMRRDNVPVANASNAMWADSRDWDLKCGWWSAGQPSVDNMGCVATRVHGSSYSWEMAPCGSKAGSVCQSAACAAGMFRCANSLCLNGSVECNGMDDCGDGSDEMNCPSECNHELTGESGTLMSPNYPSNYEANKLCTWTIVGDVGTRVSLKFDEFDTEKDQDFATIYIGGKTENSSMELMTLTGQPDVRLPIFSTNNFMIVKMSTDKSVQKKGFTATWTTKFQCDMYMLEKRMQMMEGYMAMNVTNPDSCVTACLNDTQCNAFSYQKDTKQCVFHNSFGSFMETEGWDYYVKSCPDTRGKSEKTLAQSHSLVASSTPMLLVSPLYPIGYMPRLAVTWLITAGIRQVITVQVMDLSLADDDYIQVRDGSSLTSALLAELRMERKDVYVVSTADKMFVSMVTHTKRGRGMLAHYREGCNVRMNKTSGMFQSPGYGVVNYPSNQKCVYHIGNPDNRAMTVMFDGTFGIDRTDSLSFYDGPNAAAPLLEIFSGTNTLPSPIITMASVLHVELITGTISNDVGFSVHFSAACPDPGFNAETSVSPSGPPVTYMSELTVSCPSGYEFQHDAYVNMTSVAMKCELNGKWNVTIIPQCKPKYCGLPPKVTNGFVLSTTGVTYNKMATYECFGGYNLTGLVSIACQADGTWQTAPTCQASSCPVAQNISNAKLEILSGDGTEFTSLVKYTCNHGYQIVGVPSFTCLSTGQWSSPQPSCERLECCNFPEIKHGSLSYSSPVRYEDNITINCDTGYTLDGNNTLECRGDRTFDQPPMCIDVDECASNNGGCSSSCKNTNGSYVCSCPDGYRLAADKHSCDDIDECSEGTSGCTQICNNELGSYNCSCNTTEGYVLYTTNGTEMYYIPDIETGLRKGDSYHINHTCVLRMCPSPANAIINGKFLSGAYIFRVGERASYQCDLGYVMDGSTSMTCGADGQWIGEPPKCSVATCPPLNLTGLSAPPVVSPSSAVPYMSVVNMTCTVDGYNDPVVRTRQCLYDRTTNMYRLMGDRLECPVIDCGDPGVISGSNYTVGGTNFGDSFTFVCSRLNTLQGQSTMGDHVVRCRNNSRWDFGDLACKGDTCLDPGRPADGYQNATRYEQGSLVTYTCLRAGYEPRPEFPLMCIVVGDKLQWNASVPTCEDVESPQLMNCPQEVMYVKKYYAAGIIPPSATDNSGMATVTVSPATFLPNLTLTEPVKVTYTATDPSGNAVSCMVQIRIRSEMPPSLTCPDPVIVYIENNTLPKTVQFTGAVASAGAMVTYEPSEMTYNASDIDNLLSPVVVTARDMMNNTAQCRFHVAVKAANCTPWALPAPVNGMKSCMMSPGGGYTCTMTCDAGYAFEQAAGDLSYTCDGSQDWVPGNYVPDCVATSKALFTFSLRQTYDAAGGDLNDTCIQEYTALFNREIMAVTDAFEVNLGRFYVAGTNMTAIISDTTMGILSATQVQLNMTFIFTPRNISDTDYQSMHTFVLTIFNTGGAPANPVKQLTGPAGCATVTAKLSTVRDNFMDYRCLSNSKVRYQTDDNICLECPSGQYRSGGMCHLCPLGTYQDMQDQTSCTQCPAGTWTYSMGSNKRQDCRATCGNAAGFMSDTRLPPCMECPVNSYSVNSTYCEQCPGGTVTHGTGKDNVTDCELACPLGYYSFDGFFPCQACPRGFYQDTKQSLSCQECPANTTTLMTAATHLDNCTDIATTVCTNTTCANMGTCYPQGHTYYCMCPAGYTGRHCEVMINHCDSMPCHYGAQCTPVVDGFTCNCSTPNKAGETTYTGLRCENETSQCSNGTGFPIHDCKNDAMCQDLEAGFNCLCLSTGSFTGDKCETTRNICLEEQCQNGAACMPIGATAIRRECLCRPGYTGYECETMIDYCLSNPCQHGGSCTPAENSYTCDCPPGYYGNHCEMIIDQCAGNPCGAGNVCVDNHITGLHMCVEARVWGQSMCPDGTVELAGACHTVIDMRGLNQSEAKAACAATSGELGSTGLPFFTAGMEATLTAMKVMDLGVVWVSDMEDTNTSMCSVVVAASRMVEHVSCGNDTVAHGFLCSYAMPASDKNTNFRGFTKREGSCAANTIPGLEANRSLKDCHYLCNVHTSCAGFSYNFTNGLCSPYARMCSSLSANSNVMTYERTEISCYQSYPGTCGGSLFPLIFVPGTLQECADQCSSDDNCKAIIYNTGVVSGTNTACVAMSAGCDVGDITVFQNRRVYIKSSNSLLFSPKVRTPVDGKWTLSISGSTLDFAPDMPLIGGVQTVTKDGIPYTYSGVPVKNRYDYMTNLTDVAEKQYVQVDAGALSRVKGVALQGGMYDVPSISTTATSHVTRFLVTYSQDGTTYNTVMDNGAPKVFEGNMNGHGAVKVTFEPSLLASSVRVHPVDQVTDPSPPSSGAEILLRLGLMVQSCPAASAPSSDWAVDFCAGSPCQNSGSCINIGIFFMCDCPTGFEGYTCQHNKDDCASNPCVRGQCEDKTNGFKCHCPMGYTGNKCETEINHCASDPCRKGSCTNMPSGYTCTCEAGYKGVNCREETDECECQPCLHGGVCVDKVADFQCNCTDGWEGKRCEKMIDTCEPYPCENNATCLSSFNNFVCRCPRGRYGAACENEVNICTNANPCLEGSTCQEENEQVTCDCRDGYYGQGCQFVKNYCGEDDFCKNGGTCMSMHAGYKCQCRPGYTGEKCEDNINDCQPGTCPGVNATCVDGINAHLCVCPLGKLGEDCDKDVDSDFDINCYSPTKSGLAWLANPFVLGGSGFTFKFDVRFAEENGTGTFVSMFASTVQYNLNSLTEVITFDEEGVCVSFTGTKHCMRNNPVVQIDVNDANWHEVVFTWSSSTGLIVTVDSVVVIRNMTYALGLTLPPFGWFVLGGEYDLDRRAAVVGQGFQGYLSKLTVFNRVFLLADIPGIGTDRFNDDRILLWGDYRLNRGCVRTGSSTVGTTPCRPGFVGPTCDPQPDVTPLMITCPADVHLVTSTRSKSAEWADPIVNGAYKSLTPSMMKGQTLAWGRHKVTYRVEDFAGNVAFCSFKIFVRYGCTGLSDDGICYSASTVTAVHSDVYSGCSRQYGLNTAPASAQLLQKLREHLTSRNASGDFYWLDAKWDGMSFKDAGGNTVTVAGSELASALGGALPTSGNEGMCLALSRSDGFKVTVQNCSSKAHYICSSDITSGNCETPAPIKNGVWECSDGGSQCRQCKVKCNPNYAVPRRIPEYFSCGPLGYWGSARTPSATFRVPSCTLKSQKRVRVYVRFRIQVPGPLSTQQANAIKDAVKGLIRSHFVILNNLWNNLWCYITDCSRKLSADNITVMQRSSARRRKRQSTSEFDVTFSVGDLPEMMNNTGGNETLTPLQILLRDALQQNGFNFNNDIAGSVTLPDQTVITSEPSCGPGQTLVGTSCVDCAEGTYYNSLTQTCDDCPVGQFQNMTSQTSCMMCPGGGTTDGAGSTSVADCKISCPAGSYFSKVSGSCRLCPVSYYQEQTGQFSCDPCPVDKVTRDPGADNSSMCFDDCPSGSELDDQGQCVSCPRGYYRQQGVQLRCTECPANFITPGNGSITVAECTVPDCQPGSYIDSNTCTACDNGFYQPEKWQTSCISCGDPANWRTDQIGSTMQSQCKYYCPSGYEVQNFTCVACPVGTYKDISSGNYYGMCDPCPNNKVTEQDTSISVDNCTISNCSAGYASYEDGSGCYPCPRGTYQPESLQRQCLQCINRTMYTTLDEANTSPSACTKFCPSGHEIMTDGTCRPCERGLYKDNLVGPDFELNRCTACPPGVVTDIGVTAATNASICTFLACEPGHYYLKPANACEPCLKGAYQPNKWQAQCLQCQSGETTTGTGSINETQCLKYCPSGEELDSNDNCVPCQRGYYKDNTALPNQEFNRCTACPVNFVTPGERANSSAECSIANCSAGSFINSNNSCQVCDIGQYQPDRWQTLCRSCGAQETTLQTGSTDIAQCLKYCPHGYELNATKSCIPCPQGYYKDNDAAPSYKFNQCIMCPIDFITNTLAGPNISACNIKNCSAGSYRDTLTNNCTLCPLGRYQPQKWQTMCESCDPGYTTTALGAINEAQCTKYCESGSELDGSGNCVGCEQGYYKDNTAGPDYKFNRCTLCPVDFITTATNATSASLCDVANCSAGYYREVSNNSCVACAIGYYQPQKWQTQCEQCPTDKTTENLASTDLAQCLLRCPPGKEDVGGTCQLCPVGKYKVEYMASSCTPCPDNYTTTGQGSVAAANCSVVMCHPGFYRDSNTETCMHCPRGQYQNQTAFMGGACTACPPGRTTLILGADEEEDCILDCPSGQEYNSQLKRCDDCAIGYYRNKTVEDSCQMCPIQFLTAGTGTTSMEGCNLGNCSLGQQRVPSNRSVCEPCPVGTYQPNPKRETCMGCGPNKTTENTGTVEISRCITDCPSGYQISASNVNQCDICPRNQFRNKATSTTCQPCPNGLIAAAEGATAASECIYGDCQAGSYINGSSCVTCPTDSYQDERWQTSCKGCRFDSANNDQYRTANPGATRASDCQSTNECNSAATNNCHAEHGICTNTLDSFTCSCKTGFVGDGVTCTDICDTGYCLNNATCTKSGNIYSMPTCVCREYYEGVTCAVRLPITNSHEWDYIVGFSIGGVILFIFIILLLMLICWCARRADKRRKYKSPMDPYNHVYDNPMHITNGKPLFDQHSVAPSYSMHTTRDPSRSYMFYEERDDQPVAPLSETLHRNETFRASEVQGDTFNFGDEDGYVTPVATAMGGGNVGGEPVADSEPEVRIEAGLSDPGTA